MRRSARRSRATPPNRRPSAEPDAHERSRALTGLLEDIAGSSLIEMPALGDLRYQLFSAVAGTLAAATADDIAAFIVHEFAPHLTTPPKRDANKQALAAFVQTITGTPVPDDDAWLVGPFHVPADRWSATRSGSGI